MAPPHGWLAKMRDLAITVVEKFKPGQLDNIANHLCRETREKTESQMEKGGNTSQTQNRHFATPTWSRAKPLVCVCVWPVWKDVKLLQAGAHGIHNLRVPCATKLRLWMGYQCLASIDVPAESDMLRCDVETLFLCSVLIFLSSKSCCFQYSWNLDLHDEALKVLNFLSKCVSCGGCPTRCHRARASPLRDSCPGESILFHDPNVELKNFNWEFV